MSPSNRWRVFSSEGISKVDGVIESVLSHLQALGSNAK